MVKWCILHSSVRGRVSSLKMSYWFLDTIDLTVSGVQKLILVCEIRPRTERFKQHGQVIYETVSVIRGKSVPTNNNIIMTNIIIFCIGQ